MNKESKHTPTTRTPTRQMRVRARIAVFLVVGVFFLANVLRLGYLQIFQAEDWQRRAVSQQMRDTVVSAKRGPIYASDMTPLAESADDDLPAGLLIQQIDAKSELFSKGLATGENGDIITEINGEKICGGNAEFVGKYATVTKDLTEKANQLSREGKTAIFFAKGKKVLGIIAVADTIKPDSAEAVSQLKAMGIRVVMLTGDNKTTAEAIGMQVGVDEVISGVKPDGKEAAIRKLQKDGKVAMVGDGINDAPALTRADTGIAIGAGTDVALDAADVVLVNSKLYDVPAAIRLSRATLRTIHQNLFWAFCYNVICIPVAAGAFVWAGLTLNPMIGAAAMSLSSFCVVTNALRLNLYSIYSAKIDKLIKICNN